MISIGRVDVLLDVSIEGAATAWVQVPAGGAARIVPGICHFGDEEPAQLVMDLRAQTTAGPLEISLPITFSQTHKLPSASYDGAPFEVRVRVAKAGKGPLVDRGGRVSFELEGPEGTTVPDAAPPIKRGRVRNGS